MLKNLILKIWNRKHEVENARKAYVPRPVIHYIQPELPFPEK